MRESTIKDAKDLLETAHRRLNLDDVDEQDVEKALAKIEDAKNILSQQ